MLYCVQLAKRLRHPGVSFLSARHPVPLVQPQSNSVLGLVAVTEIALAATAADVVVPCSCLLPIIKSTRGVHGVFLQVRARIMANTRWAPQVGLTMDSKQLQGTTASAAAAAANVSSYF